MLLPETSHKGMPSTRAVPPSRGHSNETAAPSSAPKGRTRSALLPRACEPPKYRNHVPAPYTTRAATSANPAEKRGRCLASVCLCGLPLPKRRMRRGARGATAKTGRRTSLQPMTRSGDGPCGPPSLLRAACGAKASAIWPMLAATSRPLRRTKVAGCLKRVDPNRPMLAGSRPKR